MQHPRHARDRNGNQQTTVCITAAPKHYVKKADRKHPDMRLISKSINVRRQAAVTDSTACAYTP
jgi:hypothetical protein